MGNDKSNEEKSLVDLIAMMLDMKRELENAKEIKALKFENLRMRKKLELGHTPTSEENLGGHG